MKKTLLPILLVRKYGFAFKNVLVIDDDKICHILIKKYIEMTDFAEQVKIVSTAKEGLHELYNCYAGINDFPDIIFLDINMPEMNGWEFLKEYAKLPQEELKFSNIIMLTSSNDQIDIKRAKENNQIYNYMEKPVTIKKLELLRLKIMAYPQAA